jgi:FkbM family methyltransferase
MDTIFDLGLNDGADASFYLDKGFRVVAVEANPLLYSAAREKLAPQIKSGALWLLNVGIWSERKTLPFYVNKANDHWSSFDPAYGCRDGTSYDIIEVPCITIEDLLCDFSRFSVPYYMKIDIEGADRIVLEGLRPLMHRPEWISVEEYGVAAIDDLHALGYRNFAIVPQRTKTVAFSPEPAREGCYTPRAFDGTQSGVFGREIGDLWRDYADCREVFTRTIRREDYSYVGPAEEWFDIHATA